MAKKRLLIITTFFPPRQHTATQRTMAWIKYLDREQFDIDVLVPNIQSRNVRALELQYGIKIHQVDTPAWPGILQMNKTDSAWLHKLKALHNKIFYNIFLDEWPSFTTRALRYIKKNHLSTSYNYVLSSYAPIGPHLISLAMKTSNPRLKLIADFRDEMSLGSSVPRLLRQRLFRIESIICTQADIVTSVSSPILEDFKRHQNSRNKFVEVKNGFDFKPILESKPIGNVFKIGYFGTLYGARNIDNVIEKIQLFNKQNHTLKLELHVFGNNGSMVCADSMFVHNPVPYSDVSAQLQSCDAFLLIQPSTSRMGIYTSKLFDYLAVNRPILGLVNPEDVAGQTILRLKAGRVYQLESFSIKDLNDFYSWATTNESFRNLDQINFFSRSFQVKILAERLQ